MALLYRQSIELGAGTRILYPVNTETLSGNKTMTATSQMYHYLDPNGSDRNVTFEASPETGSMYIITNTGSANDLLIKNNAGTTLLTLGNDLSVCFQYDGSNWQQLKFIAHLS